MGERQLVLTSSGRRSMRRALTILALMTVGPVLAGEVWTLHAQERVRILTETQAPPLVPGARGWLGLELVDAGLPESALRVNRVARGGPAEAVGMRAGDLIIRIDGADATPEQLGRVVTRLPPGSTVHLAVLRAGTVEEFTLQAARRPDLIRQPGMMDREALDSVRHRMVVLFDSVGLALRQTRPDTLLGGDRATFGGGRATFAGGQAAFDGGTVLISAGLRVVGGAELSPLNPQLAAYFGVEDGLLVLQVLEGTPAHEAGLAAGDVIVEVNDTPVREVGEMRAQVARARDVASIPLRVIRDGREMTLEFPRE